MKSIFRQRVVVPVLVAVVGSFGPISSAVAQTVDHTEVVTRLDSLPRAAADSILALTEPDTAEVLSAAESFLAAFNNLEWEAFHASFAPSATVFQPFREPWRNDGRDNIAAFFGPLFEEIRSSTEGPPYMDITPRDLRIEMLDDAGIVTFHLPGRETVGRRTLVFGRQHPTDPWRLFHLHASSLERPESRDVGGPAARDLEPGTAARYAGRYATQIGDAPRMTVVFRPADGGLEAELGGSSRALRYLGGQTFQDVESGFLFVFNVERDGQAMRITGLSPELDRVEVFERVEVVRVEEARKDSPEPNKHGPAREAVREEARRVMEGLEAAIRGGDTETLLARYSRDGVYFAMKGRTTFVPFDELARSYREGKAAPPHAFEWQDLSYEVLGDDAVVVTGTFRLEWVEDEGVLGSNTVLLARQDSELRIRVEAESMTNLEPFAWCEAGPDGCTIPLDSAARAHYVGEYELGDLEFRVFEESEDLMIEGPFEHRRNRLLHYGEHQFRLDSVPDLRLVFDGDGDRAAYFRNFRDVFFGKAYRAQERGRPRVGVGPSSTGE